LKVGMRYEFGNYLLRPDGLARRKWFCEVHFPSPPRATALETDRPFVVCT